MRFFSIFSAATLFGAASAAPVADSDDACAPVPRGDTSSQAQFEELFASAKTVANAALANSTGTCTAENIVVRKEWSTLTDAEKSSYIDAVLCVQNSTALTPTSLVPGVRSRFDDFVGTHISQSLEIHYTGTFLAWHRWFTWNYEQVLINECGYTGTQPYWNWGLTASNTTQDGQLFDGSELSMSGNGDYVAGRGDLELTLEDYPIVYLPAGDGGGCVTSGPFANMSVNLGPVVQPLSNGTDEYGAGLDYNPRCLVRDLGTKINALYANFTSIVDLISTHSTVYDFQTWMQGYPGSGNIGVHGGGHYTIAGNPGADVFTSPGDPAFYLHHGMIDRVWWIWQHLDLEARQNAISGTGTFLNSPASANTTLETVMDIGYAVGSDSSIVMSELMSTIAGPFCYTYE